MTLYHSQKRIKYSDGYATTIHSYFAIDKFGIVWTRNRDEVIWIWPWDRKKNGGYKFYVTGVGPFDSLKAIDKFWSEYFESQRKLY